MGVACGSQFPLGTHLSAPQNVGDWGGSKTSSQAHAHLPQSRSTVGAAEEAQVPAPSTKPPLDVCPSAPFITATFLESVWGATLMSTQRLVSRAGHLVSHPSPGPPGEQLHNGHLCSAPGLDCPYFPSSVLEGLNSTQENTFKALGQLHKRTSVTFPQPHRTTGRRRPGGG